MATFSDYQGLYMTVQHARMIAPELMKRTQILVVDNDPRPTAKGSQRPGHTDLGRQLIYGWTNRTCHESSAYIEMPEPVGTGPPRSRVFEEAAGEIVVCVDSHVLLWQGALEAIVEWLKDPANENDIVSGPLVFDDLVNMSTHYNPIWRTEMYGIWGTAWQCTCDAVDGLWFSTHPGEDDTVAYCLMEDTDSYLGVTPVNKCGACGRDLPELGWASHETPLEEAGFARRGRELDDEPFTTPGMGLGLFAMRRDAWPGFNAHHKGFGGEELYIHGKVRQRGGRSVCLPAARWVHRFGRPDDVKMFPLTRWYKVRNYVLEFNELGWDLEPIREHFVDSDLMTQKAWEYLVSDPERHIESPPFGVSPGQKQQSGRPQPPPDAGLADVFEWSKKGGKRDIDQHMDLLLEYASKVERVTSLSKRREDAVAWVAAENVKSVRLWCSEPDPLHDRLDELRPGVMSAEVTSNDPDEIAETDLLYIDTEHVMKRLARELDLHAPRVTRFIIVRGTSANGERGSDGGRGLLPAMRQFMQANPEWSVVHHTMKQYGMTVLSRLKEDKPKLPPFIEQAANFAKAVAAHVKEGAQDAEPEEMDRRLAVCSTCPQRNDKRCSVCGCFIAPKAKWQEAVCPLGYWEKDDDEGLTGDRVSEVGDDGNG